MAAITFTGTHYSGQDGATPLSFTQPGQYEVSSEKAAQLSTDFPQEFSLVLEGEIRSSKVVEPTSEKAPGKDENPAEASEPAQKADAPAETPVATQGKPSKKK